MGAVVRPPPTPPGPHAKPPPHNGRVRIAVALLAAAATCCLPRPADAAAALQALRRLPVQLRARQRSARPQRRHARARLAVRQARPGAAAAAPGALFVLAGGPGQSATQAFEGDAPRRAVARVPAPRPDRVRPARHGPLRRCCAAARSSAPTCSTPAAPLGAAPARLGTRRSHYTSRDSVEDIEALRVALGLDKIALYGTSYGVKVALGYALTYPANVERLVLDSVLEPDGPDPFYRPTLEAIPRVLRSLCRAGCRSFTARPRWPTWRRLVRRMGPRGAARARRGRARPPPPGAAQPRRAVPDADQRRLRPGAAGRVPRRRARRARRRQGAAAAARAALVLGRGRAAAAAAAQHGAVHGHHLRGDALALGARHAARPGASAAATPRPPPR